MFAPAAYGQAAPTESPVAPTSTVNLNLEQQHTIKELVKDAHLPTVTVSFPISVGASVPGSDALHPMPSEVVGTVPQVKTHRVVFRDAGTAVVNRNDRRIALVIDDAASTGQGRRP